MSWLRRYYALWLAEPAYDLGFGYMLAHHMAEADGLALAPLRRRLAGHFLRELYIDHRGDLYFAQNGGFGALVPLTARLGFPVIGNVRDDAPETLIARLESRAWEMATRLAARYLRDRACARCPHLGGCASAGPAALRATMEPVLDGGAEAGSAAGSRDEACPIGLRPLLADIAAARAAGRAPTRSRIPGEALQAGLEGHRFAPARIQPLDERQGELRI